MNRTVMEATEGDPWRKFGTLTNITADIIDETCSTTPLRGRVGLLRIQSRYFIVTLFI